MQLSYSIDFFLIVGGLILLGKIIYVLIIDSTNIKRLLTLDKIRLALRTITK